jgi:tetratricopeptide (TPR) repeat protein
LARSKIGHPAGRAVLDHDVNSAYCGAMQQDDPTLSAAARLIAAGRYGQAVTLLSVSRAPGRHALLGAAYLGRRHGAAAVRHFRAAVALDPADQFQALGLGKAYLATLDAPAAVDLLQLVAARHPAPPGVAEALARAFRRDARYEEALAVAPEQASPALLYERAHALLMLGRAEDSLAAFDSLLKQAPLHAAGWFWSHAPALDVAGWADAERRLVAAAAIPRASRKYLAILASYDLLRHNPRPRSCPTPYRHWCDAAALLAAKMQRDTPLFGVPAAMLRWSLGSAPVQGLAMEFGVRRGNSIRILAAATQAVVHGFDSFEGLPEPWVKAAAGALGTGGHRPVVPDNVILHPGWFADSLAPFLAANPGPLAFANIDCDIYSSTRTVLWALADRINAGTVLLFDELIGNRSWRHDEYRALSEFAAEFGRSWQVLAINLPGKQVALRLD